VRSHSHPYHAHPHRPAHARGARETPLGFVALFAMHPARPVAAPACQRNLQGYDTSACFSPLRRHGTNVVSASGAPTQQRCMSRSRLIHVARVSCVQPHPTFIDPHNGIPGPKRFRIQARTTASLTMGSTALPDHRILLFLRYSRMGYARLHNVRYQFHSTITSLLGYIIT